MIRERRRRPNLEGDVNLQSESSKQSRLENWIEFQDYHLQRHETLEKKLDDLRITSIETSNKLKNANAADFERAALDARICEEKPKSAEQRLKQHEILLRWIE